MNLRIWFGFLLCLGWLNLSACAENACVRKLKQRCDCCETAAGKNNCLRKVEEEEVKKLRYRLTKEELEQCAEAMKKFDCSIEPPSNIAAYCHPG